MHKHIYIYYIYMYTVFYIYVICDSIHMDKIHKIDTRIRKLLFWHMADVIAILEFPFLFCHWDWVLSVQHCAGSLVEGAPLEVKQKELQLKNVFIKNHNLTLSESIQVNLLNPTRNILPRTRNQLDSSPRHSMQLNVPPPCRQQHLQPWLHCVPPSVPQAGR